MEPQGTRRRCAGPGCKGFELVLAGTCDGKSTFRRCGRGWGFWMARLEFAAGKEGAGKNIWRENREIKGLRK